MRDDQLIRSVAIGAIVAAYGMRTLTIGNGAVVLFGYSVNPFAFACLLIAAIAVPELTDALPFGPSRSQN